MTNFSKRLLVTVSLMVVLAGAPITWAILAEDSFLAIRHLKPSKADRFYTTGGISGSGDVFGMIGRDKEIKDGHNEVPIRWRRDNRYTPELVTGGIDFPWPNEITDERPWVAGEDAHGLHAGFNRDISRFTAVTSKGFVSGVWNIDNWFAYHYDMTNDKFTNLGRGMGSGGNNNGLVAAVYSNCCGAHSNGMYSKILDVNAPDNDPEFEIASFYPTFGQDIFSNGINDANIIFGNVGSIFGFGAARAMVLHPTGDKEWNGSPVFMESLPEDASAEGGSLRGAETVLGMSNNDNPFAVGISGTPTPRGVIWDVTSGKILADFGALTQASGISPNGKFAYGTVQQFAIPPQPPSAVVWSSDDGWQTWKTLDLNDVLFSEAPPPGSEIWDQLNGVHGINDDGMVVGNGTVFPEFLPGGDAGVEGSIPEVPGPQVFLLDTRELGSVLLGDVNNDGATDNLDITPFIAALAAANEADFQVTFPRGSYAAADIDMSGGPDNLDITPFINLLAGQEGSGSAVPEPASLALLAAGALTALRRGRQR